MLDYGFDFTTTYLDLPDIFYTRLPPVPVGQPELVCLNTPLAKELGLDFASVPARTLSELFAGNLQIADATPFAQAYAGHQYARFTMLGDGRACILGEHNTPDGLRFDIQFKGSGQTPYSRRGDGRAALAPMLREYIISEAMHALGIATTRSLAVVRTGETVDRDGPEPGAILTRVASSHIRVGTFEFAAAQGKPPILQALFDYTARRHMPEVLQADNPALAFLREVMKRQANLIADWMRVGFIHGVMNTDNMTISGETIDYGPCAFMDTYHPQTVFSSIDHHGRYAFGNQPSIAQWNLARLAETLLPLISDTSVQAVQLAEEAIADFEDLIHDQWLAMMRGKLGLIGYDPDDIGLISELLTVMQTYGLDYTNTFHDLRHDTCIAAAPYSSREFRDWHEHWTFRKRQQGTPDSLSQTLMQSHNPVIIPRNHWVERALTHAEDGDLTLFKELLAALAKPYTDDPTKSSFKAPPRPQERVHQTFCGT